MPQLSLLASQNVPISGPWMTVGMRPKRESWFNRVLDRVLAEGMSDYELAHLG